MNRELINPMNKRSFTLVEVMIVVMVISIMAAIAIPNALRARLSANDATAQATLKSLSTAMESYYAHNAVYPSLTGDLINTTPPYMSRDYFTGTYSGFTYSAVLNSVNGYTITATPVGVGQTGTTSFAITTGGVFQNN